MYSTPRVYRTRASKYPQPPAAERQNKHTFLFFVFLIIFLPFFLHYLFGGGGGGGGADRTQVPADAPLHTSNELNRLLWKIFSVQRHFCLQFKVGRSSGVFIRSLTQFIFFIFLRRPTNRIKKWMPSLWPRRQAAAAHILPGGLVAVFFLFILFTRILPTIRPTHINTTSNNCEIEW